MADNQTQQRDQDVVTYESFTGLRNEVTPERFTPADLAVADNIDLDKSGRIARRDGYTLQRAGAAHSLWSDRAGLQCFFVAGGQLMRMNADLSSTAIATLSADLPVSFEKVNDVVYFSNGIDANVIENGAVRSWGMQVPPLPGVALTVGGMPAGTYQFAITYQRLDGQESGAPLAGSIYVPDNGGLDFSWPAPADPAVTMVLLYLSTPSGDVLYLADAMPVGMNGVIYRNDTTELSTPLNTQFLGPAPAGQLVAWYRGRMFVAAGDVLYPSEPFGHELFDLRRYIPLDGRITLLAPLIDREMYDTGKNSGLFVGTDRSCGVLIGSSPEDFQYVPKADFGAVEGALDWVDGALFGDNSLGARDLPMFLTTQGVCVGMPEMTIRNLSRSKYSFPVSGRGAALFMPGPNRFIATNNL